MSAARKAQAAQAALLLLLLAWLAGPAAADVLTSVQQPTQDLGVKHSFTTIAVSCRVTLYPSGTPVASYYHAAELSNKYLSQIYPEDFCLHCAQNPTNTRNISALFTVPNPNGSYFTSLNIQNLDNSSHSVACQWKVDSIGDLDIHDEVEFFGDPKYYNPSTFSPKTGGPSLPVPKSFYPIIYEAKFVDYELPSNSVTAWFWSVGLQHVGGSYELLAGTKLGPEYIIGAPFTLPDKQWLRDGNGNVLTIVRVRARTNDFFEPQAVRFVGVTIPPNRPGLSMILRCPSKVELFFAAAGASAFQVHYGPDPKSPLLGTDAKEGPSPVAVGTGPSVLLTGLGAGPHAFAVSATNAQGVSPMSEILELPVDANVTGPIFLNSGQSAVYQAVGSIVAPANQTFRIDSGATASFRAGKSITLRPGFSAEEGSQVAITIAECK